MALTKRRQSRGVRKSRRVKTSKKSRRVGKGRKSMRKSTKRRTHRKYQRGGDGDWDYEPDCENNDYDSRHHPKCKELNEGTRAPRPTHHTGIRIR
jgi:hypothetical protein